MCIRDRRIGMRVIRGDVDCRGLADDIVLAVAIAIDPMLLVRPKPLPPAPPPLPEPKETVADASLVDGPSTSDAPIAEDPNDDPAAAERALTTTVVSSRG